MTLPGSTSARPLGIKIAVSGQVVRPDFTICPEIAILPGALGCRAVTRRVVP
jgi:hypothetical protein